MPVTFRYPNLISVNGVELTDESREPLQEDRDERSSVVELASGKKKKFIKGIRRKWSINWTNVAESSSQTVDGKGGRNDIRTLAQLGTPLTFVIHDGKVTETYTVFVDSYSESLIMRRTNFRYSVTLSLEEQG